jgi:hypothetical protein
VTAETDLMHWLTNHAGPPWVDWLALAIVAVVIAVRIGIGIYGLLTHKRDSDKSEKEYRRIHGG